MIDAVGMEAHGAPVVETLQSRDRRLPDRIAATLTEKVGTDRTSVLHAAIDSVRRGGTVSLIGVYSGAATPMPMIDLLRQAINSEWVRQTSERGRTICFRSSPTMPTRSAPRISQVTCFLSTRLPRPTRCSSRSRWGDQDRAQTRRLASCGRRPRLETRKCQSARKRSSRRSTIPLMVKAVLVAPG